ncbi:response regulator, partial [Cereibacter azotoformans]|uniref:response regulator n=1 Tax=Cereibacter azotoformans TaxID=43057 RepID=UPI001F4730EC
MPVPRGGWRRPVRGAHPAGGRPVKVLVVEDDRDLAGQIAAALAQAGYTVELAHDGEEGEFLGATETVGAAVLDLGLPGIDG